MRDGKNGYAKSGVISCSFDAFQKRLDVEYQKLMESKTIRDLSEDESGVFNSRSRYPV